MFFVNTLINLPQWLDINVLLITTLVLALVIIIVPFIMYSLHKTARLTQLRQLEKTFQQKSEHLHTQLSLAQQQNEYKTEQLLLLEQQASTAKQELTATNRSLLQKNNQQERQIGQLLQQSNELSKLKHSYVCLEEKQHVTQQSLTDLQVLYESQKAGFEQQQKAFEDKLQLLKNAEQHLSTQFENLANKIFEQKAEKFTQSSEIGLNHLLSPLKQQIEGFKKQITEQYVKEGQERASLKSEIYGLKALNLQITQEAAALTNALKGDNKQQGNWGEVVLAKVLDESGLREGHEYEIQKSLINEKGKQFRPDVIVHLPNNKDIIIDSKVSLLAHEKVVNALDANIRKAALKEHVNSVKGHIKGLSKKDYQDLEGVRTLDYVLMFIPIESAFVNAVQESPELVKLAMDNQIMLVSPTNLLVALRTINNIWQYEYQNQHAKTIADKAKKMYDKFAGFVDDMQKIGKNIEILDKNYESALNKLSEGRGNLIAQAESFKNLGVTPSKKIDEDLLSSSE